MSRLLWVWTFLATLLASGAGCSSTPINGRVVVAEDDTVSSFIATRIETDLGRYPPLAGARVFLSVDGTENTLVEGTLIRTDAQGRYTIRTCDLPDNATDGYYFLHVEKQRHESFKQKIIVGAFAPYIKNTVYLLKQSREPKGGAKGDGHDCFGNLATLHPPESDCP